MERIELVNKILKKYNLIDNGLISTYIIGIQNNHNRRKIYKRFLSIDLQRNSITNIEVKVSSREINDLFSVKRYVFQLNTNEIKAIKIIRYIFSWYGHFEKTNESIQEDIDNRRILNYKSTVKLLSYTDSKQKLSVHKPKYSQKQNVIIETKILP